MNSAQPVHYKIHIEPDLSRFTFSGTAEILLESSVPVNEISLNILELAVWSCRVRTGDQTVPVPFLADPAKEMLRVYLPSNTTGQMVLFIAYEGIINDSMAGFYRSRFVRDGRAEPIAVTQFEESSARRAFPCMDHPGRKATFDIELAMDERLSAISNTGIREEKTLGNGKKLVVFERTPRMSTYLVFFGVGEFDFVEDSRKVRLRAATMPGLTGYAGYGLRFARKSLDFCEDYFALPYPLSKLDLIAIPDFAFGAMENWGAITFRENLLLYYPGMTSRDAEERICEVIAHEIVHQWFGNLVTPSDWKYLWLNESFATYFGYGVVDHYHPQWNVWDQFVHGQTITALERDALHETFSIEIPGGEHVVINTSTAPIIYSKGGSILRQIEGYLGAERFREGLRHYLKKFQYDCATSRNFWEAFEEVSDLPVTAMMKSWVEKPGYPVVEVERNGRDLVLRQRRFTYLPGEDGGESWLVPVRIRLFGPSGGSEEITTLLEGAETRIPIGEAEAYKVNAGQTGFFRVRYRQEEDLVKIGRRAASGELSSQDRWGLQDDLFALAKSGEMAMEAYLRFLSLYDEETAFLPLIGITDNLFRAYLVMEGEVRQEIASRGKALIEKSLARIGFAPAADESHTTSVLRDRIILQAVIYGSTKVEAEARQKHDLLLQGKSVAADLRKSIMQVGALVDGDRSYAWLVDSFRTSGSEHERMNILQALGSFRSKALVEKALRFTLEQVPSRNRFVPVVSASANPFAVPCLWQWFLSNLEDLEKLHPMHFERIIAAIVPVGGLEAPREVSGFLNQYAGKNKDVENVVRMSLEKLEINVRWRNRN